MALDSPALEDTPAGPAGIVLAGSAGIPARTVIGALARPQGGLRCRIIEPSLTVGLMPRCARPAKREWGLLKSSRLWLVANAQPTPIAPIPSPISRPTRSKIVG